MLRKARKGRRLTQAQLAKRARVTRETVYRTELGRLPTPCTLARLADAAGIDRDALDLKRRETDTFAAFPALAVMRERRLAKGLSLTDCAAAAGVSPATLSRFECGAERSRKLVEVDVTGRPRRMINAGLAEILGFSGLAALDTFWRTGRDEDLVRRPA